jgi:hypothetical protein
MENRWIQMALEPTDEEIIEIEEPDAPLPCGHTAGLYEEGEGQYCAVCGASVEPL